MKSRYPEKLEILAVEDGPENQVLLQLFLKEYPCRIDVANNGEEAVRMYSLKPYDVVLMDMLMPVKDGYEATRDIRGIEKEQHRDPAHIIALTAHTLEEQIRRCERAGCNFILHKPLSPEQLWELLNLIRIEPVQLVVLKEELEDLIPGYIDNRYLDLHRITILLERRDYESIGLIGHRMKGSGSGYGLDTISRLGIELATAAAFEQSSRIADVVKELALFLERIKIIYLGQDDQA
ncbi:response regulator [Cohnella endophytica]|uniref:Response regulator n=1 Tax=Cohnella endophytica TaxID=2419778 RepID=A0A494XGN2_9BACL|nr:response regulator [Cohnella endophytica]RKP49895.1 response regulator [Cohnella endophytica]